MDLELLSFYHMSGILGYSDNHITSVESTYPATLTVSSAGGAATSQSGSMGVYKITNQTFLDRPVWQMMADYGRFLFYQGNINALL